MHAEIKSLYIADRVNQVDPDYLRFEENLSTEEDLKLLIDAKRKRIKFDKNPYNSIMLYVTGLTDQFDQAKARCNTRGGSPPD